MREALSCSSFIFIKLYLCTFHAKAMTWVYLRFWDTGAWEAFFQLIFLYFHCTFIISRNETGNFKLAYLKSCILDNITGNKRFRSHFQPEWLEIYRIHCSICIQWKNGKKIQIFKYTQVIAFAWWLHIWWIYIYHFIYMRKLHTGCLWVSEPFIRELYILMLACFWNRAWALLA